MFKNLFIFFILIWLLIFITTFTCLKYEEFKLNPILENIENDYLKIATEQIKYYPDKFTREKKLKDIMSPSVDDVKYTGWIPIWALDSGIQSLTNNAKKFHSISPVYYEIDSEGKIKTLVKNLNVLQEICTKNNIKLIPTISSFNADYINKFFENIEQNNEFILQEIDSNNYDGIDLNYESIYLKNKDDFFKHINFLKTKLKERNKLLYITVLSKWSDRIKYSFAPQTRTVQDYQELSKIADKIRIMTYDYTSQTTLNPGPIAPIDWIEQVLIYATNRIEPSKISLGIHLYGYVWSKNQNKAIALNYREISQLKHLLSTSETSYSQKYQEAIINYIGRDGNFYFGYYSNPESIYERIKLASKYGVTEISFWRLGDDPL